MSGLALPHARPERARRRPAARLWRAWPGHGPHIVAIASSYTVIRTAFLTGNARFLPLTSPLPETVVLLVPGLSRYRRPSGRCAATAPHRRLRPKLGR